MPSNASQAQSPRAEKQEASSAIPVPADLICQLGVYVPKSDVLGKVQKPSCTPPSTASEEEGTDKKSSDERFKRPMECDSPRLRRQKEQEEKEATLFKKPKRRYSPLFRKTVDLKTRMELL
ncbi:unnamed protein product [Caenorhabditis sp. 36 PRJEB53466]|nr:unnamed protein product [Caenorhabditis sp. 36 PRJEB53466]